MQIKAKLAEIVGKEHVDTTRKALLPYAKDHSLLECNGLADAVVWPDTAEQVQKIVQLANEIKMPVIPASSRQHFHGSTLPKMGGIIVDLKRMNRILDFDVPDRLVRIEPGVTWGQLQPELMKIGHRMVMPLMPLADSSVVASLWSARCPPTPATSTANP